MAIRGLAIAIVLGVCIAAAYAQDAPAPSDAPSVQMDDFCPQTRNQTRFYPSAARNRDMNGEAQIDCAIRSDGELETCQIVREAPSGYDFGDAALRIACRFESQATTTASANNTVYTDATTGQRRFRRTIRFNLAN
jgi:TonB family protein